MNFFILFLALLSIGIYFIISKTKFNKSDLKRLKDKLFKKKLTEAEKEFNKGNIIFPIDKRDFVEFSKFLDSIKDKKELIIKANNIDKDFKDWDWTPKEDNEDAK